MGIWEKLQRANSRNSSSSVLSNAVPNTTNAVKAKDKITRTLNYLRKLAVDSTVDHSLKAVAGGVLVDKIVKDGLKNQSSLNSSANQDNKLSLEVAEVVRAGIEKLQENANCVEPQMIITTHSIRMLDCFEDLPKEPIKGSNSSKTAPKRIMIRSRL